MKPLYLSISGKRILSSTSWSYMANQNSQLNSEVVMANHSGTIKRGPLIKAMMSECKTCIVTKLRAASGSLEIFVKLFLFGKV